MILGVRKVEHTGIRCLNVFRCRDWLLPIEGLGTTCFNYFDDSIRKLQKDPEATRLSVPKLKHEKDLTLLNTATATALRSVPEKRRSSVELYSLAFFNQNSRFAWTNLPRWAKIYIENRAGEIFQVQTESNTGWTKIPFEESDAFLHLSLFHDHFFAGLAAPDEAAFFRTSKLLNERRPDWLPTWSLSLRPSATKDDVMGDFA